MPAYDSILFTPPAPIAKVTLRNPETGKKLENVLLLIDSGADATLLPKNSIDLLGISTTANTVYELTAFDGSTSTSLSVRADLLWQGKTFKGEFLIIEQEIGYLGRDILNHLSLLLDGRNLIWETQ